MAKSESDKDSTPLMPLDNKYPYGLRITLTDEELDKLNVDHSEWEVGETFPIHALVKVIGKNANETEEGKSNCSIQLQITHLAGEYENEENEKEYEDGEPSLERHGYLRYGK